MMKQLSFNVFFTVRKNRDGSVGRFKDREKRILLACQPAIAIKHLCSKPVYREEQEMIGKASPA